MGGHGPRIIIRTFGPNGESISENIMGESSSDPFSLFNQVMHDMHDMHDSPRQEMHQPQLRTPRFQKRVEPKPPLISINATVTLEHVCQGATIPVEMERWNVNSEGVHELSSHVEYISVPMGAENGEVILLSNRGNETGDGTRGDVKVTFIVEEHPLFKRNGLDILLEKSITLKEALCGFAFDIAHINGKKFSFNSSSGNIIRDSLIKTIPRLGLHRGNEHGNLNVVFKVAYPEKLSEEQIKRLSDIL